MRPSGMSSRSRTRTRKPGTNFSGKIQPSRRKNEKGEALLHQYGQLLEPADVVRNACGTLDPQVYLDYLTRKYTELYAL